MTGTRPVSCIDVKRLDQQPLEIHTMDATTISIDLAKNCLQLAVRERDSITHHRLTRTQAERWFARRAPAAVVMESCGTAHHWGRWLSARGYPVRLLPPLYVKAYVRRDKTDRADALALLEAAQAPDIRAVPIKTVEQQALQHLHRVRSQLMADRTARLNTLRGILREYGIDVPLGASRVVPAVQATLEAVPTLLHATLRGICEELRTFEARIKAIERELKNATVDDPVVRRLQTIPGIGLLTATALVAAVPEVQRFRDARRFASWLGLTPSERSSGMKQVLGRISKRGDVYLRTLLTHGARAVLWHAKRPVAQDRLRRWAVALERRVGHNKAALGVANKLARIAWAVWTKERDYAGEPTRPTQGVADNPPGPQRSRNGSAPRVRDAD
jgi:transposase